MKQRASILSIVALVACAIPAVISAQPAVTSTRAPQPDAARIAGVVEPIIRAALAEEGIPVDIVFEQGVDVLFGG